MVGCNGSVPHFFRACTGRSAVAEFRARLIEMERGGSGVSLKDARYIVSGLQPHVIEGPLTPEEAYRLDLGWRWSIAVGDASGGRCSPAGPVSREVAVRWLGEDRVASMERQAAQRYGRADGARRTTERRGMEMDDGALEEALANQERPVYPGTLQAAREQVEGYMAPGIAATFHLTGPEARVEATRILAAFERMARDRGRGDGQRQAQADSHASACRSTRHCADHGWCHRCDPGFARTMNAVNAVVQDAVTDVAQQGRLYTEISKALRNQKETDD